MRIFYNLENKDEWAFIDEVIILNVENRYPLVKKFKTIDISGKDGSLVVDETYPPREITVHFLVKEENSKEFNRVIKKLKLKLAKIKQIYFSDYNTNYYLNVRIKSFKTPHLTSSRGVGSFIFYCEDPFYYSKNILNNSYDFTDLPIKIVKFESYLLNDYKKIILQNDKKGTKVIYNGNFKKNSYFEFHGLDFITINKEHIEEKLDFVESDVDFEKNITLGDEITFYGITEKGEKIKDFLDLSFRGRYL